MRARIVAAFLFTTFACSAERIPLIREELHWQGWVSSGQSVEINNLQGDVRAEMTDGKETEIIAVKKGDEDPQQVSVRFVEHKGGITICAAYPDADARHAFDCKPSHGGGFQEASQQGNQMRVRWENGGGGDVILNDLRVDFVVRVPKGVRFIGRTVDGQIVAKLTGQDVEAHAVKGDVHADVSPAEGATLHVQTSSGALLSDYPLAYHSTSGTVSADGHVGRSQRTVRLRTLKGDIFIDRIEN